MKPLLLLLLLLISQSLAVMKIIQIFGKVTFAPIHMPYYSFENCASDCFEFDDCLLSWKTPNGTCYHYSFLYQPDTITVVETDEMEGSIVGFKTNIMGTSCPSSPTDMDFKMTILTGDTYSWKKTGSSWSLNGCRDGWQRFDRTGGISVCMQTYVSENIAYDDAVTYCNNIEACLTGVASEEESQWIHGELVKRNPTDEYFAFWLYAHYETTGSGVWVWDDKYTKGDGALNRTTNFLETGDQACLAVTWLPNDKPKTIKDISCHTRANGYVCGYLLRVSF